MKTSTNDTSNQRVRTLAYGSISLLGASHAGAAIVINSGPGPSVTIEPNSPVVTEGWDIDGDMDNDFTLRVEASFGTRYLFLDSNADGRGFIHNPGGSPPRADIVLAPLQNGFVIGNTLDAAFAFSPSGITNRQIGSISSFGSVSQSSGTEQLLRDGTPQLIGFRFDNGGNTHFGWAEVRHTEVNGSSVTFAVDQWAYESTPGASIQAGAVPEPGVASLSLLAAGAMGLRRRRELAG